MKKLLLFICFITGYQVVAQSGDTLTKINALIRQMTLAEKVNMIHASSSFTSGGVPRLGIRELVTSDGPHGVRPEHGRDWNLDNNIADSGTYLPAGVCLAATWNPQLGYQFGSVLGSEANYRGKDVILGPGINIIRSPLNGRNFEYMSEDPYLVSQMVVNSVKGIQDQGISACVKHYAANNQETKRFTIDVQMSERALREIYLPGFKAAIQQGGANTIMGSYNKFRGQWASENYYLLTHILRKEWGFKGIAMSDWDAVHNTVQALWNGMDLEMGTDLHMLPNPDYSKFWMADTVVHLVKKGLVPEYLIDEKVRRILYVMYKTKVIDGTRKKGEYNTAAHQRIAASIAEEGIVLLKNNNILPLNKKNIRTIAVIGYNAERKHSMGGGSSQVRAFKEITPLESLKSLPGISVSYAPGYEIKRGAVANADLIKEAVAIASKADVVLYVGGSTHGYNYAVWKDNAYDAEDTDRPDMKMPFGQDELLTAVLKANPRTIVTLVGGGAIDMSQWVNTAPAIIQYWYPGMFGGEVLTKILFGDINPSGKLPMSFPKKLEDHGSHALGEYPGDTSKLIVNYTDDIYVGYRYYDKFKVEPQFAFGHGLSYTKFNYSGLKIANNGKSATITFTVSNSGNKDGAEVAQLYISQENTVVPRPEKELKGFKKLFLKSGQQKTVTIKLNEEAFQYYNDLQHKWVMDGTSYNILIGGSSRDIRLTGQLKIKNGSDF